MVEGGEEILRELAGHVVGQLGAVVAALVQKGKWLATAMSKVYSTVNITVHIVQCTLYIHFTVYSVHSTVDSILCTLRQKVKWLATELVKSGYLAGGDYRL